MKKRIKNILNLKRHNSQKSVYKKKKKSLSIKYQAGDSQNDFTSIQ